VVEKKATKIVPADNKVLFEVFKLQEGDKIEASIEKIKAALESKTLLKTLHKHTFSDTSVALLLPLFEKEAPYANVVKRFRQIELIQIERTPIARGSLLRHALFIEWTLATVPHLEDAFHHLKKTGLQHSLQVDGRKRNFYIIAHPLHSILQEKEVDSTFKRVMTGVEVQADHYDRQPETVACLHTKIEELTLRVIRQDVKNTHREIEFCREFSGKRGIAEFRTATQFAVDGVPRLSMIFTMRTCNLAHRIFKDPRPIPFKELVVVLKDLVAGLTVIRAASAVHAVFKPPNILLQMNGPREIVKAEICDFGITFRNTGERKKLQLPLLMRLGNYGTVAFTAPELYGVANFTGDFYALDVWALGGVLYELFHRKPLPWSKIIDEHEKTNFDKDKEQYKDSALLHQAQAALKKHIESEVEAPLAALEKKANKTAAEQYEYIFLSMLRLAPDKRATPDALNQMAASLN
jgi:serine/threonine protein kinase